MQEIYQEDIDAISREYIETPCAVPQVDKLIKLTGNLDIVRDENGDLLSVADMRKVLHTLEVVDSGIMRSMLAMARRYDEAMDAREADVVKRLESMSYKSMQGELATMAEKVHVLRMDNTRLHRALQGESIPSTEWGTL